MTFRRRTIGPIEVYCDGSWDSRNRLEVDVDWLDCGRAYVGLSFGNGNSDPVWLVGIEFTATGWLARWVERKVERKISREKARRDRVLGGNR